MTNTSEEASKIEDSNPENSKSASQRDREVSDGIQDARNQPSLQNTTSPLAQGTDSRSPQSCNRTEASDKAALPIDSSKESNRDGSRALAHHDEYPEPPERRVSPGPHNESPADSENDMSVRRDAGNTGHKGNHGQARDSMHDDRIFVTIGKSSFRASAADAENIRRAQRLTFIASTCGIFSLFFGGIVLGTIGLIAALVAYRRLGRIGESYPHDPRIAQTLKHNGRLSIAVCAIALALNIVSLIILFPALIQAVDMGDYSQLLNGFDAGQGAGSGTGSTGSTSAWG